MPHEDQFTAIGPPLSGSGFPLAGFSTGSGNMDYGVNVTGKICGVYGSNPKSLEDRTALPGTGIEGSGENFGVVGHTQNIGIAGVFGIDGDRGFAVLGVTQLDVGTGVVGVSFDSPPNPLNLDPRSRNPRRIPEDADGPGTGVLGASGSGDGVQGFSQGNVGVRGH